MHSHNFQNILFFLNRTEHRLFLPNKISASSIPSITIPFTTWRWPSFSYMMFTGFIFVSETNNYILARIRSMKPRTAFHGVWLQWIPIHVFVQQITWTGLTKCSVPEKVAKYIIVYQIWVCRTNKNSSLQGERRLCFLTIGVQMGPSKWHPQIELGTCNKTKYIVKLQRTHFLRSSRKQTSGINRTEYASINQWVKEMFQQMKFQKHWEPYC